MNRKILSAVLSVLMILCLLPMTAFAEKAPVTETIYWDYDETEKTLYLAATENAVTIGTSGSYAMTAGSNSPTWFTGDVKNAEKVNVLEPIAPVNTINWFYGFTKATDFDLEFLNTENAVSMSGMFSGCSAVETLNLSGFRTESVTDFGLMFNSCEELKTITGLDKFNTAKATDMGYMFNGCKALASIDVSSFDVSKVKTFDLMFRSCESAAEIKGLSGFKTDSAESMAEMFASCNAVKELDVSGFHTENVTDFSYMFSNCETLERIRGIESFNIKSANKMKDMFYSCKSLKMLDLSGFDFNSKGGDDMNINSLPMNTAHYSSKLQCVKTPLKHYGSPSWYENTWYDKDGIEYKEWPENSDASVTLYNVTLPRTVTFDANGGKGTMNDVTVEYDGDFDYTLPACAFTAPSGMTFAGWSYEKNGDIIADKEIFLEADTTLYAMWENDGNRDCGTLFDDIFNLIRWKIFSDDMKTFSVLTLIFEFIRKILDLIFIK